MIEGDDIIFYLLTDEMSINLNVLCSVMVDRILGDGYG